MGWDFQSPALDQQEFETIKKFIEMKNILSYQFPELQSPYSSTLKQLQSFTVYYVHIKACPYLGLSQVLEPASNVDAQDKSEDMRAHKGRVTCGGGGVLQ